MNRAEIARKLLINNIGRRVTLRMLADAGIPFYTARNAVAEAKKGFNPKVFMIRHEYHKKGEAVADNGWILEQIKMLPPENRNGQFCWKF